MQIEVNEFHILPFIVFVNVRLARGLCLLNEVSLKSTIRTRRQRLCYRNIRFGTRDWASEFGEWVRVRAASGMNYKQCFGPGEQLLFRTQRPLFTNVWFKTNIAHTRALGVIKFGRSSHSHAALGTKLNFMESNNSGRCNKRALFSGILCIKYNIYSNQEFVDYSSLVTMQAQVSNHKLPFESDN